MIKIGWAAFKALKTQKDLAIQVIEDRQKYILFMADGNLTFTCEIPQTTPAGADQEDFQTNYLAGTQGRIFPALEPSTQAMPVHVKNTAIQATLAGSDHPSISKKLRYSDMAGISRGSTVSTAAGWVSLYSYTGSGLLFGFVFGCASAKSDWAIRIVVDGEEVFGSNGVITDDLASASILNLSLGNSPVNPSLNISVDASSISWTGPINLPVRYATNVQILVRRLAGTPKVYNGGIIVLTRET